MVIGVMSKYWKLASSGGRVLLHGAVILIGVAAAAASSPDDVSERIRAVAGEHDAGVTITATGTYYTIFAFRPPRGHRATITLVDHRDRPDTIAVAIYEQIDDDQQIRLLVDNDADGYLNYVLSSRANGVSAALKQLRSGESVTSGPDEADRAAYATLRRALVAEVAAKR